MAWGGMGNEAASNVLKKESIIGSDKNKSYYMTPTGTEEDKPKLLRTEDGKKSSSSSICSRGGVAMFVSIRIKFTRSQCTYYVVLPSRVKHIRNSIYRLYELLFTCSKLLNSLLFRHSIEQAVVSAIPWKPIDGIVVSGSSVLPSKHKIFQRHPGLCEFLQHL